MNFRKKEYDPYAKLNLAFLKNSCLNNIMLGSEVPQPDWYYFLEMERVETNSYRRTWFHLDNICQKDHSHIPETIELSDELIIKRIKKTRNPKLPQLLYQKINTKDFGLVVEVEDNAEIA